LVNGEVASEICLDFDLAVMEFDDFAFDDLTVNQVELISLD
jgi:hypothetical protein